MEKRKISKFKFPQLNGFDFFICNTETNRESHFHEIELHTHSEYEIYINLSGDISFLVENKLYPVTRGDIIIAKPTQQHHCVYRSDADHKFFWILFDCQKNPEIMSFLTEDSFPNYISPNENLKNELIDFCFSLLDESLSYYDRFYYFFRIITLIKNSANTGINELHNMPRDLICILDYIDEHISENIKIADIANRLYISESTVVRRFKNYINMNPLEFIKKKKLSVAAQLLRQGESVLNAGLSIGFSDNSYFIKLFKKQYGVTPFQFKRQYTERRNL